MDIVFKEEEIYQENDLNPQYFKTSMCNDDYNINTLLGYKETRYLLKSPLVGFEGEYSPSTDQFVKLNLFMNSCAIHEDSTYPPYFDPLDFP